MSVTTQNFTYNLPNYNFADMIGFGAFGGGFNQYGCNFNPSYVNMGLSIFGMVTQAAVSYIDGRGGNEVEVENDTPAISDDDLKKQAATNVDNSHHEYKENIADAENKVTIAKNSTKIISESKSAIDNLNQLLTTEEYQPKKAVYPANADNNKKAEIDANIKSENKIIQANIDKVNEKIKALKEKIQEEKINLSMAGFNPADSTEIILDNANKKLKAAQKERDDAIDAEYKTLKQDKKTNVSTVSTVSTSKQLAKAQAKADKAEQKKLEAEAKKKAEQEANVAKQKEDKIKSYRKQFANALKIAKNGNRQLANEIITKLKESKDSDFLALAVAFSKELDNKFGI